MNNVEALAMFFFFFLKITFLVIVTVSSQKTHFQRKRLPIATITSASEPPTVDTCYCTCDDAYKLMVDNSRESARSSTWM